MRDTLYQKLVQRWEEVTDLPPQTLGPLTPYYKMLTRRLKQWPWPVIVVGSVVLIIGLYLVLGSAITLLVTLLQRGF
ncbi:MAG: hypothetical protein ACOY0S_04725 [Patescibacteria group bacterium]